MEKNTSNKNKQQMLPLEPQLKTKGDSFAKPPAETPTKTSVKTPTEPARLKPGASSVTVPETKKPTFITKTDPRTHQPIKVMVERPVPTGKKYEKGFIQPDYQFKEEYFYIKWRIYELQRQHPENLYAMFSASDVKKDGAIVYWWKFIGPDVLKYKFFYRPKIANRKPCHVVNDADKIFQSEDGVASINSIDWLRTKMREIGIESRYLGLFIVEFSTDQIFSEVELNNFRNYHGNIVKKFQELNQPKNIDVEYKRALTKLDSEILLIIGHVKDRHEYAVRQLEERIHRVRTGYHFYCNGKISRASWQTNSSGYLDEMEVCLQAILDHHQNLGRAALRAQEQINIMRPSLLTKEDIDKKNAELKQKINQHKDS
ncbi:hypothetical protein IKE72_01890 [Candidatus Saccharibacteria bacterium]|nr:hypothetical protein [Candidatus Saccharibacteria bacterium]